MWNNTEITRRLSLRYPIIQGPFGGGLSTVRLAATVTNAGGLGSFGAHLLMPSQIDDTVRALRKETSGPFALNLWVSDREEEDATMSRTAFEEALKLFRPLYSELGISPPTYEAQAPRPRFDEQMDAILEAQPPVFSFVFGIPSARVITACRERNIVTIGAATTVAEALAVEAAGVDMVLATGAEAGGHRPSFLRRAEDSLVGTFALVAQVARRVRIPVIAAGGIANGNGVAAALRLGAQAAQLGTAFLACEESGAAPLHRDWLFSERAHDTVLSRGFTGRLARFIRNDFLERIARGEIPTLAYPVQDRFMGMVKRAAAAQQKPEFMSLYSNQAASLLRHRSASELMRSLVGEIEAS